MCGTRKAFAIGVTMSVAVTLPIFAQDLDVCWHTIDGGGGTSSGGAFVVSGTFGQSDAGTMTGEGFKLDGGFWAVGASACPPSSAPIAELISGETSTKNRFLSFTAGDGGRNQAIRVTFESMPGLFEVWNGFSMWVGPPREVSEAGGSVEPLPGFPSFNASMLQRDAFYADWTSLGLVHVFHEAIISEGEYSVQVIDEPTFCGVNVEAHFSAPLDMVSPIWGDTLADLTTDLPGPPDGTVNIIDALAVIGRFGSAPGAIVKARADLEPGCLDLMVTIIDVLMAITGFQGLEYPFEPTAADPRDSTCESPFP